MLKRSSKTGKRAKSDPIEIAARILAEATGEQPKTPAVPPPDDSGKNPAAVALGRLGGLKGGKARATRLTKSERVAIAKRAAKARWSKS